MYSESIEKGGYLIDPAFDLAQSSGAAAVAILAYSVSSAWCAVEEVLLHAEALVVWELRGAAGEDTVGFSAGMSFVSGKKTAHHRLALQVARCALAAGAFEAVFATAGTIFGDRVFRAGRAGARAHFCWVAFAIAGSADGGRRRILAPRAAVLVGVAARFVSRASVIAQISNLLADSVVLELAGLCVTALVIPARISAAVAVLAGFDDSVAAHLLGDDVDASV